MSIVNAESQYKHHIARLLSARRTLTGTKRIKTGWIRKEFDGKDGKGGEVREFYIDFGYYKKCLLPHKSFFTKKYFIDEGENPGFEFNGWNEFKENAIVYIAVFDKDPLTKDSSPEEVLRKDYLAARICAEGQSLVTNFMATAGKDRVGQSGNNQPAKQCGLATILSYFCYLDREFEHSIMGTGVGYDFASERRDALTDNEKQRVEKFIIYVQKTCQRVLKVMTVASPTAGGRSYIYAGMDAGYQYLMTIGMEHNTDFNTHKTEELSEEFQRKPAYKEGDVVVDPVLDKLVEKEGKVWFLCKMIK